MIMGCGLIGGGLTCAWTDDFVYDLKNSRDPFSPLVTPDGRFVQTELNTSSSTLLVQGIVFDEIGRSYAVVNNEVVSVADIVAGYQVLKIEPNSVFFIKDGRILECNVVKEEQE